MVTYKLTVATGIDKYAGTFDYVYGTVIGELGQSQKTALDNAGRDHYRGCVKYDVNSKAPLGDIWFVELEKRNYIGDDWFCRYLEVKCPDGSCKRFPCYRWIVGNATIRLREGSGKEFHFFHTLPHAWRPGIPKCIDAKSENDLALDHRFNYQKTSDFKKSVHSMLVDHDNYVYSFNDLNIKNLLCKWKSWNDLEDFRNILFKPILFFSSEYVMEHWKEDWFFGYQFLNGCNPRMIKSCFNLPEKFPVTEDMVQATLGPNTTLNKEMKDGKIYLVDYCILEGIPVNVIKGKRQYVTAPLCLLYDHLKRGLIPLAIQIQQKPGQDNPIFLPSDPELDWLLAKMWVRHAEFQVYEALSHLLRTHLVSEVFCIATMRHLPTVHPVYKLLIPHMRDTLQINTNARLNLISENGIFKEIVSTGGEGLALLVQKECQVMNFRSLLPPFDFEDRNVSRLKNYFYRDDSLKQWEAMKSFVSSIVDLYYSSNTDVMEDKELQNWIHDVVTEGFRDLHQFDKTELVTILAGVIFTSSAQHAAINSGQFDWCSWVPNTPCSMRCPPPTRKGLATMDLIMNTLPDVHMSCFEVAITWVLSRELPTAVWLGQYPEDYFIEKAAKDHIEKFQEALKKIEKSIDERNANSQLKYEYLSPRKIENSIAI
uniref:Arachidonate 12-lipoxygenase n=1 Tax=Erpetoichthys calabaricus TaxID=27687 RepID=A0A8C4S710_ERPCA